MKNIKEFKPLINLLKEEKWKLIIISIILFICTLSNILTGYLNGAAIEAITKMDLEKALYYLLIYFVFSITLGGVIYLSASSNILKIESKLTRKLGFETYKKALNLPAYAYEKKSSGEIINRITSDSDTLSFTFRRLIDIAANILGSFILLFYIFYNSYIVGIEIVIIIILLGLVMKIYNPKIKQAHKERREKQDDFTSLVNESIRGVREIKTLGVKNNLITEMKDLIALLYDKSLKEIKYTNRFNIVTRILKIVLEILVFITCAVLMYYHKASLTFFVAMTYYVYKYTWLIESLTDFIQTYQKVTVSLSRVNEILQNKLFEDEKFGNKNIENSKGKIEFKNVYFSYPNEDTILNNFNLKLEPNKKIAIVGKSGQGKSTLFNLITRLFEPTRGNIYLDNVNLKDLTEKQLRQEISIIRQEPFIFNRTILENFKIIDKNLSLKQIRKYTKQAYLDDYIMSLPDKYDTKLGEGGVNLSGGQKQRLSIARTLAKESKVILFDEATSALDNNSQTFIKKAIDNLVINHTIVIVAHRLSTIIDADIIYVVDKGRIVAQGKHNELLQTSEIYKNLYETESLNS